MNKLEYLSDEMVEETLKEAADTFFGKRKKIDQEMELLFEQAKQLRRKAVLLEEKTSRLNYLLLDDDSRSLFWSKIGLEDSVYPSIEGQWKEKISLPWAMTRKGKYQKSVLTLYDDLKFLVRDYLYGRHVDHPEIKGKKVITPNLTNITAWAENINEEIQEINSSSKPDDVLAFTRRMDVDESAKRECVGAGLEYNFDQELCFKPVDFSSLGLAQYPELPDDKKVYAGIAGVCVSVYKEKKDLVKAVVDKIYKY